MKLVKYYKDNCPGCEMIKRLAEHEGIAFDAEVHVINELSKVDRIKLKIMAAPTVILFDDNGHEVARMSGADADKLKSLVEKRGA